MRRQQKKLLLPMIYRMRFLMQITANEEPVLTNRLVSRSTLAKNRDLEVRKQIGIFTF